MISNRLRVFECAAIFEIGSNASGAKSVAAGGVGEGQQPWPGA